MNEGKEKLALRLSIAFALLILACAPCGLLSSQAPTPSRPLATSPAAAQRLEAKIKGAWEEEKGEFTIHLTDEEATSYLAFKLEEAGGEAPVKDIRVWFTAGKIHVTGDLSNLLPLQTQATVVASAEVVNGQIQVTVEKALAGSIPIPAPLLNRLSQTVSETLQEATSRLPLHITGVEIEEGEMVITGSRQ